MKEKYLMISRCEDEVYSAFYTKEELLRMLNVGFRDCTFLEQLPVNGLEQFPAMSAIIIKGNVVIPKPEKIVEIWEIE